MIAVRLRCSDLSAKVDERTRWQSVKLDVRGMPRKMWNEEISKILYYSWRMLRNVQNLEFHGIQSSLSSFSFGCFHHGIPPGFITPDDFCALHSALAMCFEDFGNRMSSDIEQRGRVR